MENSIDDHRPRQVIPYSTAETRKSRGDLGAMLGLACMIAAVFGVGALLVGIFTTLGVADDMIRSRSADPVLLIVTIVAWAMCGFAFWGVRRISRTRDQ